MVLTRKKVTHPPLYFNSKVVEDVQEHKHLGLTFNTRLSGKDQVLEIMQGVSTLLDVMYMLSEGLIEGLQQPFMEPLSGHSWKMLVLFGTTALSRSLNQ